MIIFKAVVGSQLHGFATQESDTDFVTVRADNLRKVLSLYGDAPKGNQSHAEDDSTTYELRHFCRLLVKGNPTVYDALFSHLRVETGDWDSELVQNADRFIDTKNIYMATCGYVHSTMKEAANGTFTPVRRGKKALAALRVLRQGHSLLTDNYYSPRGHVDREFALKLKKGDETAIFEAQSLVEREQASLDALYRETKPRVANIEWINDYLYRLYRSNTIVVMPPTRLTYIGDKR